MSSPTVAWLRTLPLPLKIAGCVWLLMVLIVSIRVLVTKNTTQTVYPIYFQAAERFAQQQPLYATDTGLDVYRYPPSVAMLFVPFTWVPIKLGAVVWRLLGLGLYALAIQRSLRVFAPQATIRQYSIAWLVAGIGLLPAFNNGQLNLFIAAAALLATVAMHERRWLEAGLWCAMLALCKLYPLALGLVFCVMAPLRFRVSLVLLLVAGATLPWCCRDSEYAWSSTREYVAELSRDDRSSAETLPERTPRDWTVIPRAWFGYAVPRPMSLAVSALAGLGIAVLALILKNPHTGALPNLLGLVLVWMTVFGPATEHNTYVLLTPACALLLAMDARQSRLIRWCARLGTLLLFLSLLRAVAGSQLPFDTLECQPFGGFCLAIALLKSAIPIVPIDRAQARLRMQRSSEPAALQPVR